MERLAQHAIKRYVSSGSVLDTPIDSFGAGSKNLLILGMDKTAIYKGPLLSAGVNGGRVMANIPDGGYASLGNGTTAGVGSIAGLTARAFAFVGGGPLFINGATRSVNASTAAQMILYKSGAYTGSGTGPFTLGLLRPTAPTIAETPTVNTEMSGTVAASIAFVRAATGGRSRASEVSNILVVDGKTVRITIAGADLTTASTYGYDRLIIGVTQFGFGATGPVYQLTEIAISSLTTVDTVANSYELVFTSAALAQAELMPTLDYTPPAFVFLATLEDVLAGVGAYGDIASGVSTTSPGTAVVISLPIFIESWPPDSVLFLPEAPTGVLSRAADGFCFVGGQNSMSALLYTGGRNPVSLRTVWPNVGIMAQHNFWLGEGGRLYAFTSGKRGLVRLGEDGEPETRWAADVADDVKGWTAANVIGGFDDDHQLNVVGHDKTLLAFSPQARDGQGAWCAPLDLTNKITGSLCACVTVRGGLLLAANDGTTVRLYSFNAGTGTVCEVYFPPTLVMAESANIFRMRVGLRADGFSNPVQAKMFKEDTSSASFDSGNITLARGGKQIVPVPNVNTRGARIFQPYFKMTGAGNDDCGPDYLEVIGETSDIVRRDVAA